jgi:hypothetical protein
MLDIGESMSETHTPEGHSLYTVVVKRTALYKETVMAEDADKAVDIVMDILNDCEPIDGTTEVYDVWEMK